MTAGGPARARAAVQTVPLIRIVDQALRANAAHGFIFLNNPKVGCSTIKASLWRGVTGHSPAEMQANVHQIEGSPFANRAASPEAARDAFVFAFVRNPFQRLVSAYLDKVEARKDQVWTWFAERRGLDPAAKISFDGFVELLSGLPPEEFDPHWRPQHLNILYPFVQPNLLGDLESLDGLLPEVLARLFPGQAAPRVVQGRSHATAARQVWVARYADPATLARVKTIYAADFDCFGYRPSVEAEVASQTLPLRRDGAHEGLAALSRYFAVTGPSRFAALNAVEAVDKAGTLQDWILLERLRHPRQHQSNFQVLKRDHAAQIAAGPAFLQRAANPDT